MSVTEYLQNGHWIAALSIMSFSFFAGLISFAGKTLPGTAAFSAGIWFAVRR